MKSKVTTVEITMPKIITMPMGWSISLPSPVPTAMGIRASTVVRVVIRMGRTRRGQAARIASFFSMPLARRMLI